MQCAQDCFTVVVVVAAQGEHKEREPDGIHYQNLCSLRLYTLIHKRTEKSTLDIIILIACTRIIQTAVIRFQYQ